MVMLAADGTFFKSQNGNYAEGVDTELSVESLRIGVSRMLSQRDKENRNLDIQPRTLLVPPELQHTAKTLLESEYPILAVANWVHMAPCHRATESRFLIDAPQRRLRSPSRV
ncbi:Mu-like prophage major head subunit gpT family protein [Planctomycetaceae bacterium SH139]